ncbi:RNA-binding, CRM domain-containing protein [Cynara cardunculus var. scolymus]|uniref:RNA-binding, CRM domain-containing protein n=1 Tax=Cynara cardunculus var. scolymus TaxID=59895 RepID=A0A103XYA0_CYNCS|nr:RNA-binding, CRM domain-containing protein [Cynara cardunculus var. scolymus]
MLKLFSRRRCHHHLHSHPLQPILFISRQLTQSHFDDDPPFSPILKTLKPQNQETHNQKNKKQKNESKKKPQSNFPLKSDLPFDFRYSYSETNPAVEPIGYRETPKFSPFGPGRLDRKWTGTAAPSQQAVDMVKVEEERNAVLGEPLSEEEVLNLVELYRHNDCCRQINLGKGGVTHNMIDDIHNHWKKAEAIRIKCLGEKSGGKIIYRQINILLLYRGRNYDPKNRPVVPLMLWKPYPPIYPKLIKNVADGLTFEETKEMRNRGLNSPPFMKL